METRKVEIFDDWKNLFYGWQKDISYNTGLLSALLGGYGFGEKFAQSNHDRIGFGEFAGARKWESAGEEAYRMHLKEVLPTRTDREKLRRITKDPDWIAPTF